MLQTEENNLREFFPSVIIELEQWFSMESDFAPQGTSDNVCRHLFLVVTTEERRKLLPESSGQSQDGARHPTMHRTAP